MSTDEKIEKEQDKTLSKLSKASGLSHKKLPFWKTSLFQTSKGTLSFRSPYSSLDHIKSIKKKRCMVSVERPKHPFLSIATQQRTHKAQAH
jgi:hypothetical protein